MVDSLFQTIEHFLAVIGLITIIFLFFERLEKIRILIAKWTSSISQRSEKTFIAGDIEQRVNKISRRINLEVNDAIIDEIDIEWVDSEEASAYIRDKKVIVVMKKHQNQDINIVSATMAYVSIAVLPQARKHLEVNVRKSIDYTVAKNIILSKEDSAIDYFYQNIYGKELETNEIFKENYEILSHADIRGVFTRIILREFIRLGRSLYDFPTSNDIKHETDEFLKFIGNILMKGPKEEVALQFPKKFIRVAIVLVARPWKIELEGLRPYIRRVKKLIVSSNFDSIYVIGGTIPDIEAIEEIVNHFRDHPYVENIKKSKFRRSNFIEPGIEREDLCFWIKTRKLSGEEKNTVDMRREDLLGRIKSLKQEVEDYLVADVVETNNQENVICLICTKTLKTNDGLAAHIYSKHVDHDKFICEICNNKVEINDILSHIQKSHMNENMKFVCEQCKRTFVSFYDLRNHQNVKH
jgi:hypothetical protein